MNEKNVLREKYLDWLYEKVMNPKMKKILSYKELTRFLFNKDFSYTIPMDDNRFADGVDLRYRFGREEGYSSREIATELDNRPCSVLEMMVALALRIEEQIMANENVGDRTFKWFWEMLSNLGLAQMQDEYFDEEYSDYICERFLNREYKPNGDGGLFTIYHQHKDMRNIEIWDQAMWYLSELDDVRKGIVWT